MGPGAGITQDCPHFPMVIRVQPDVGNTYSHPLPLGLSLDVRDSLERVRKEADLERANQLRSASVPNYE